ncbi:protein-L-isoaspartate O-methyltransferase family protein [Undibacter mobilis]|uniref:Protein-L-isoaspartate O-methyltransferase n=1 Tax=Undibacter mobilis TaxID=2292256 RepID=A0A371B0K9_9BRAD|nr:protein-L-isoaspartate O-methyltransferase [Undibacter mobilis]RDV01057.1 protein-L-isoaspartate O-methyltransferase [Undibacter mobilis]
MTDFASARRHMVDGQIRPADVTDLRITTAMLEVPREAFVPEKALAYLDLDLNLGVARRCLMKPMVLAKLIQALEIEATDKVLIVGAATGYSAAILARMAGEVVALEQEEGLARSASAALTGTTNVKVVTGPLSSGYASAAPYDAMLVEGAVEELPDALRAQLKDGGRLVCVMGAAPGGSAMAFRRSGAELGGRRIFDASAAMLPGFAKAAEFAF